MLEDQVEESSEAEIVTETTAGKYLIDASCKVRKNICRIKKIFDR